MAEETTVQSARVKLEDGLVLLQAYLDAKRKSASVTAETDLALKKAQEIAFTAINRAETVFNAAKAKAETALKNEQAELSDQRGVVARDESEKLARVREYEQTTGIAISNMLQPRSGGRTSL